MSAQRRLRTARSRRRKIASTLDALKHERITLEQLLERPPVHLRNVTINYVLLHAPRLGPEGIKKCLLKAKVWPEDKMGKLSDEQRQAVIDCLPPRATKYHGVS